MHHSSVSSKLFNDSAKAHVAQPDTDQRPMSPPDLGPTFAYPRNYGSNPSVSHQAMRLRLLVRIGPAILTLAVVGGALMRLVPYGRDHTNPPVTGEPAWPSVEARAIAVRACFDCHSNQTTWPWYSNIAPLSWAIQRDIDQGRAKLNFSEWNLPQEGADNGAELVTRGEMPPIHYSIIHPEAQLSAAEKQTLVAALAAFGGDGRGGRSASGGGDSRGRNRGP
jgi:hypothetical protein